MLDLLSRKSHVFFYKNFCNLGQSSIERQTSQITVNAWDFGEGRLRPRIKASSADTQPTLKAKCKICLKHYKASYIDVSEFYQEELSLVKETSN